MKNRLIIKKKISVSENRKRKYLKRCKSDSLSEIKFYKNPEFD
jgi:hypothetical protein